MSNHKDSGPAFPIHPGLPERLGCMNSSTDAGMSLRDYFAAQALAGLPLYSGINEEQLAEKLARTAYLYADAMLKARDE